MSGLKPVNRRRSDALAQADWKTVESLLADYYRDQGYAVDHVGTAGTGARFDGGVDLKLRRDDAYIVVQCKHWNAMQVTHNAVHELLGIMVNESATGAILVTSGEFTRAAKEAAARQGHVRLIDGDELRPMLAPIIEAAGIAALSVAQSARSSDGWGRDPVAALFGPLSSHFPLRVRSGHKQRQGNAGWWIATLIGAIVFVLLVRALLGRTAWSAGADASPEPPAVEAEVPAEPVRESAPVVAERPANVPAQVDPATRPLTPAEQREAQRKADEAMKVIEATTPEI
jgi:hypothetical protein